MLLWRKKKAAGAEPASQAVCCCGTLTWIETVKKFKGKLPGTILSKIFLLIKIRWLNVGTFHSDIYFSKVFKTKISEAWAGLFCHWEGKKKIINLTSSTEFPSVKFSRAIASVLRKKKNNYFKTSEVVVNTGILWVATHWKAVADSALPAPGTTKLAEWKPRPHHDMKSVSTT